ncbi:MAG TPA: TonB-dependent receptor [Pseudolabrys sp.]|nr:TonB-dependent receptor [Pseudolabrys sp.]
MRTKLSLACAAMAAAALIPAAQAQDAAPATAIILPTIEVGATRIGAGGMTGASTSIITSEDLARSAGQSLPDIIGREAGVQVLHQSGNPLGANDAVDLRGFGAFASSNVLILVNGRRYQDFDLQGFDFASIPRNSIERIEITRGNSGSVLYGDGAVGGVINVITKTSAEPGTHGRVEGAVGSYGYQEGRFSSATGAGPWSASLYSNVATVSGYRQNSETRQENAIGNINYRTPDLSGYLTLALDQQRANLPGDLPNLALVYPVTLSNPRASVFPNDWGHKQDLNLATGVTKDLWAGAELTIDGGIRRKFQQSQFYNYFPSPTFTYDSNSTEPANYVNTEMTTTSLTPRLTMTHGAFGVPNELKTGVDLYNTQYGSDRSVQAGSPAIHHYDIRQTTAALYALNKTSIRSDLDVSYGGRVQWAGVKAADDYNAAVDPNAGFYASSAQAPALDSNEWQYAAHLGVDYRLTSGFAVFGRVARAFRLPNADERVGAGSPFFATTPATFDLKTQTSHDVEGGFRVTAGAFYFQSSAYVMDLNNEIHFIPADNVDVNLDPTRRIGWENTATFRLRDDLRLHAAGAYTHATFREGTYAGNDVPLVSHWSGSAGVSWDIVDKLAALDVTTRFWSSRYMDNDQTNTQPKIPANATVDVRLGGEYERFFWSLTVQNLFNVSYFDYSIASATTQGYYAAFPQPGRTFIVSAGATF